MSSSAPADTRASLQRISRPANRLGLIVGLALIGTAAFAVSRALPVIDAISAGTGNSPAAGAGDSAAQLYAAALNTDKQQINGRSFFFNPPPPPPPPRPAPPPAPPVEHKDPGPPPPPSSYGGPKVIGTVFDTVWFDNGKTMQVGGPLESDMRIISIRTAPYVVRIEWKKVEFDVPFLPRDRAIIKDGSAPSTPEPTPEPPPPAPETKPATPPATPSTTPPATPAADPNAPKPADGKPADSTPPKTDTPATPSQDPQKPN